MKTSNFGKKSIKFLVADDEIGLQKIILGLPFLNQTYTKMHFHPQKSTVKSLLDFIILTFIHHGKIMTEEFIKDVTR